MLSTPHAIRHSDCRPRTCESNETRGAAHADGACRPRPGGLEAFGLVLIEAQAHGLPIAYSDLPSAREILGSTGVPYTPCDPRSLAAVLDGMSRNTRRRKALSRAALHNARRYDITRHRPPNPRTDAPRDLCLLGPRRLRPAHHSRTAHGGELSTRKRVTVCGLTSGAPKPSRPGPRRPPGSKNRRAATRQEVGRVLATGEAFTRRAHHKKGTKPRRTGKEGVSADG